MQRSVLGMLIFPPLAQILLDLYGWRVAHQMLAGIVFSALVLLVACRSGGDGGVGAWKSGRGADASVSSQGVWTVSRAVMDAGVLGAVSGLFRDAVAAYSVLPHSVAYLVESGFSIRCSRRVPLALPAWSVSSASSPSAGCRTAIGRVRAALWSYVITLTGIVALIAVGPSGRWHWSICSCWASG